MRVLQEDYDAFYRDIRSFMASGEILRTSAACAVCPPKNIKERIERKIDNIKQDFNKRLEPHDDDITLYGEMYGIFIDSYYKKEFIKLKKRGDWRGIESLTIRAAKHAKEKYADKIEYTQESVLSLKRGNGRKREISLTEKIKNFFI